MGNIGGGEILVILLLALIVLGPDKLPDVARQVGRAVGEMRKISTGFQREIQDAMRVADEPKPAPAPAADAAAPETFLPTEPAALTETELAEAASITSDQSVETAATNEPGESAPPVADDVTTMIDTADTTDTFLTTEPDALTETIPATEPIPETETVAETEPAPETAPVRASTSYPGVVTPPEAPPLPTDVALGGDR